MTLEGYERSSFTSDGATRDVYRAGAGPAVVVMAEIPGITPKVAAFGLRVAERGMTAVLPHLFGRPGRPQTPIETARTFPAVCVSREFTAFATGRTSPIAGWLRALCRAEHARCGGPGVGAIGMCFTGGFALALMVDESVVAPVLSQPSLPFPISRRHKRDLNLSDADLARVKERAADGVCVLGLRFSEDRVAPPERFQRLREELGDAFLAVEIDSSPGNPWGHRRLAHSVLTEDLVDEPGQPTREALDRVLQFFADRLGREY